MNHSSGITAFALAFVLSAFLIPIETSGNKQSAIDQVKEKYLGQLDQWASQGGDVDIVQSAVVQPCGRLVMLMATKQQLKGYLTNERETFDFRVDTCVKMAVNKVHGQPEFSNAEIVDALCFTGPDPLFDLLCSHFEITEINTKQLDSLIEIQSNLSSLWVRPLHVLYFSIPQWLYQHAHRNFQLLTVGSFIEFFILSGPLINLFLILLLASGYCGFLFLITIGPFLFAINFVKKKVRGL